MILIREKLFSRNSLSRKTPAVSPAYIRRRKKIDAELIKESVDERRCSEPWSHSVYIHDRAYTHERMHSDLLRIFPRGKLASRRR